jgi:hypothetical protein
MNCSGRFLSFVSLGLGAFSVGVLALAVATDAWLFTIEPGTNAIGNGTVAIHRRSGLWRVCTIVTDGE